MVFRSGLRRRFRFGVAFPVTLFLSTVSAVSAASSPMSFHFEDPEGRNLVQFRSKAPLETVVGTTSAIRGEISVDSQDVSQISGRLVVDLASFDTGIGLRNDHMREQFLHTDEYPEAVLVLLAARPKNGKSLQDGKTLELEVDGDLTLHGVTRPVTVEAEVTYHQESEQTRARAAGDLINVDAQFEIKLTDFDIERPKMLILKVADEVQLKVEAVATSVPPRASR